MFKELGRNNRLLMLALFIWALGEGLWFLNLRQLFLVELGASEAQVGLALALEAAGRAMMPIPAGRVADLFGTRRVVVYSWYIGLFGTLICALATSWQTLIPGLLIYALSGFAVPALSAYALQNTPDQAVPGVADRVLTTIFASYTAGLIISPTLGGLIADRFGIRACVWLSIGIFAISTLVVMLTTRPSLQHQGPEQRPRDLLTNSRFLRLIAYFSVVMFFLFIGDLLVPNFLRDTRGFTYSQIGLLFSVASAGTVVINLVAGRLNPRWNFPAVLMVVCLALLGIWQLPSLGGTALAFFALGGIYSARALGLARVGQAVSVRNQGLAFGLFDTLFSLALALAAWTAGGLYGLTPSHELPLIVGLAGIPVMIGLWFVVRNGLSQAGLPASVQAPAAPGNER